MIENQNKEECNVLEALEKKERESSLKISKQNWWTLSKIKKIKTMIDFNRKECNSIKSVALKTNRTINVTLRLINGKMLMFAKISLKYFVYNIIDVFCSPTEEIKMIYDKHDIIKCFMYLNLTDTDSFSCFFNFIYKKNATSKKGSQEI